MRVANWSGAGQTTTVTLLASLSIVVTKHDDTPTVKGQIPLGRLATTISDTLDSIQSILTRKE